MLFISLVTYMNYHMVEVNNGWYISAPPQQPLMSVFISVCVIRSNAVARMTF